MGPTAFVLLCLVALASAAPQCSTSCIASNKTSYTPGSSYTYDYLGSNKVHFVGYYGGGSYPTSEYSAAVTLTVLTPCDIAISLQNVPGSNIEDTQERNVEKYPLMVSVQNGRIDKVCSHQEDDIASINLKKAIASAFHNVMPSLEEVYDKHLYEVDIIGTCFTKYNVIRNSDNSTDIQKYKNYNRCREYKYQNQKLPSILATESFLLIRESESSCRQEIKNGIYSSVDCTDLKHIRPEVFGIFNNVRVQQEFTLKFVSESSDTSAVSPIEGQELKSQSLVYQWEIPIKNSKYVQKVDAIMPEICTLSQGQGNKQVAALVAQAIELLRHVPGDSVVEVLNKIRAGQYCSDYSKLESLFLDAVAFVGEPGAVNLMAQEIAADRTSGGRLGLYTVALNLLTKPSLDHVSALTPIFRMENSNQLVSLAASSVVNRYCTQNEECGQADPIKVILNQLSTKLKTQCKPDFSNTETAQVLITLKSFGNIGQGYPELFDDVLNCALTEGIENNTRFAAVMSLKGVSCDKQLTQVLKDVVLDASMSTEVRIGSYLAAVRCADANDLEEVIIAMASEPNIQVQGFILSHLENLQETNWPLKQNLRSILASKNIPNDYMRNIFKYSRNVDMSLNNPKLDVGILVESNIVYTPESYVPRLINLGLNMNLLGSFINIGEVGARVEELDQNVEDASNPRINLYEEVFGPESVLWKSPLGLVISNSNIDPYHIIKAFNKMLKSTINIDAESVLKYFDEILSNEEIIDIKTALKTLDFDSIIKYMVNYLTNNKFNLPKIDLHAILKAQERAFFSLGGEKRQFTTNEFVKSVIQVVMNALASAQDINVDTARMGQINLDYSIPTISGMPLKIKLTGTGVAGIILRSNLNAKSGAADALLKIIPSFSGQIEGQIGFGENMNTGIKLKRNVYTTNGFALKLVQNGEDFELKFELPEKMELLDIDFETFFMNRDKTSKGVKVYQTDMKDTRIEDNRCMGIIESVTGLLVCYNVNAPNLMRNNRLPLGQPMKFRIYFEKSDTALKGYRLGAKLKNNPYNKLLKIAAGSYGSANSKESTLSLSYAKHKDTHLVATNIQSTFYEVAFVDRPEYKSLQYYTKKEFGTGISVDGSVKIVFKPLALSNGNTYEVAFFAGFTKVLVEKDRQFHVLFSLLENGDKTSATLLTKSALFPVTFEAGIELPHNAGLRIYKVESLTLRSTVSSVEVEVIFIKKYSEVYETILNIKRSGSALATFNSVNTISIESPLTGFETFKLKLMTNSNVKLPMVELGINSGVSYDGKFEAFYAIKYYEKEVTTLTLILEEDRGITVATRGIGMTARSTWFQIKVLTANLHIEPTLFRITIRVPVAELSLDSQLNYISGPIEISSEAYGNILSIPFKAYLKQTLSGFPLKFQTGIELPTVLHVDLSHTLDRTGLTTAVQVKAPAVMKPLMFKNVFGINNAFNYSFLTDVTSEGEVVLHMEGPLTYTISTPLIKQHLDVKISGAFDGDFNVMHGFTLSMDKIQNTLNVRHTNTPVVFFDIVLEIANGDELSGKVVVHIPFVIESELGSTITTSSIQSTLNTLVLPSTEYARIFMGYVDFNWVENNFKGELDWDAGKGYNKRVGLTAKYALDLTTFKFVLQGELSALTLNYGYKLESTLASPYDWFQGNSYLEITVTLPSQKVAVAKKMIHIQYTESQVTLKPLIDIITTSGNKYELSSCVTVKPIPRYGDPLFLNFDITCETTFSTPQLQHITLVSRLLHQDKDTFGNILFKMTLKESFLSKEFSFAYACESAPETLTQKVKAQYGTKVVKLVTEIVIPRHTQNEWGITHELSLPLENVKFLVVKITSIRDGSISFTFLKNEEKVLKIYNSKPITRHFLYLFVNQIVGIESNTRTVEFSSILTHKGISIKIFPEKNKSEKVFETAISLTSKANALQFDLIVTTNTTLSEEIRFAVELGLIEPGKDKSDMVSIDFQYQVSEAPKLLRAILSELQSFYIDFVNDGLLPDLSEMFKMIKQLPEILNDIREQLMKMGFNFYNYCYYSVKNVYLLHEANLIVLWNEFKADSLMNWEIIRIEAPAFFVHYMEVIKSTETWNALQTTLKDILVNYPAYYDHIFEFHDKVIVNLLADLSETVSRHFVFTISDISQYMDFIKKELSTIIKNVVSRLCETSIFKIFQDKYYELNTKAVQRLRASYPVVFDLAEELYQKVIIPTINDNLSFIQQHTEGPIDLANYLATIKTELPGLVESFGNRVTELQMVKDFQATYPTVFEVVIDIYSKVILPTYEDVITVIQELISIPISDFQESIQQPWNIIDVKIRTLFNNFVQRLSATQLVTELKTLLPTVVEVAEDFYKLVLLPTTEDAIAFVNQLVAVLVGDINEAIDKYWEIMNAETPNLMTKFILRIHNLQIINLLQTKLTQQSSILQNKFEELEAQYPELAGILLDFYTKVIVGPTISDVPMLYSKLNKIIDPNQLMNFVTTNILLFVRNLLTDVSTTDIFHKIMNVIDQLAAAYPNEYNAIIKFYKDIKDMTLTELLSVIDTYLFDKFGISFSISAEMFKAVFCLPVSVETLRKFSQIVIHIMEALPEFLIDEVFIGGFYLGRYMYVSINTHLPLIMRYLQYVVFYIQQLQVTIPQLVNDILTKIPGDVELFDYLKQMIAKYYEMFVSTPYGKITEDMVEILNELLMTAYDGLVELYPEEFQALSEFVHLYMAKCVAYAEVFMVRILDIIAYIEVFQDFATQTFNTVLVPIVTRIKKEPIVRRVMNYITSYSPENAQSDLIYSIFYVMETIVRPNEAILTEVYTFVRHHIPDFVLDFLSNFFFIFWILFAFF